ncbi:MAG: hypothetical protein RQ733_01655 [Methyloprofundus sp.]|nr:hypothetical protein [Methyloprofundus sp.]MDT8424662.1 hypothetical protein [Methyloprofundus sp.]
MSEKTVSSSLQQLEQQLADKNPALLQAFRLYHELDQVAYDLGLIGIDDSLANKTSWSPIITVIGDASSGKIEFINHYLNSIPPAIDPYSIHAQFTVLIYRDDQSPMTLPGTAVDGDPRFPFFHISERLEQLEKGASRNINSYLELKTNNSNQLKDKTIILAPGFAANQKQAETELLREHASTLSDLVFVFFDARQSTLEDFRSSLSPFLKHSARSNNPSKYIYVINEPSNNTESVDLNDWKQQLIHLGLEAGQFFVLSESTASSTQQAIEQKLTNIDVESAYRILNNLQQHITEFDTVVMHEVQKGIDLWKDRSHFTLTVVLSFIALTLVAGEIQMGLLAVLLDPFVASVALFLLIVCLIPVHIYSSKVHAKFIAKKLAERQVELGLIENLPALFNKGITLWRILLPIRQPVGWTSDVKDTLDMLMTRAKGLVQSLNNTFSTNSAAPSASKEETFLNL